MITYQIFAIINPNYDIFQYDKLEASPSPTKLIFSSLGSLINQSKLNMNKRQVDPKCLNRDKLSPHCPFQ